MQYLKRCLPKPESVAVFSMLLLAIVCIALMPVASDRLMRSSLTAADILSAFAPIIAAAGAAGMIAWQVNIGFQQQLKLRQIERWRMLRTELFDIRSEADALRKTATVLLGIYPEFAQKEPRDRKPFKENNFRMFCEADLTPHIKTILRAESLEFEQRFRIFEANRHYINSACVTFTYSTVMPALKQVPFSSEQLIEEFDRAFPALVDVS